MEQSNSRCNGPEFHHSVDVNFMALNSIDPREVNIHSISSRVPVPPISRELRPKFGAILNDKGTLVPKCKHLSTRGHCLLRGAPTLGDGMVQIHQCKLVGSYETDLAQIVAPLYEREKAALARENV